MSHDKTRGYILFTSCKVEVYIFFKRLFVLNDLLLQKIKQPLKKLKMGKANYYNYTGFSVLMAKLFGRENKNSNFHNFLNEGQNNPSSLLNLKYL